MVKEVEAKEADRMEVVETARVVLELVAAEGLGMEAVVETGLVKWAVAEMEADQEGVATVVDTAVEKVVDLVVEETEPRRLPRSLLAVRLFRQLSSP